MTTGSTAMVPAGPSIDRLAGLTRNDPTLKSGRAVRSLIFSIVLNPNRNHEMIR